MSGDLEDFLKRAAARRQAKAQQAAQGSAQRPAAPPPPRSAEKSVQRPVVVKQAPPYTDSRRERVVTPREEEEPILVAEIVDTQNAPDAMANRRKAVKEAKTEAARVAAAATTKLAELRKAGGEMGLDSPALTGDARADLIRLLRQPGGIKQAILLKEILDRPIDRW